MSKIVYVNQKEVAPSEIYPGVRKRVLIARGKGRAVVHAHHHSSVQRV